MAKISMKHSKKPLSQFNAVEFTAITVKSKTIRSVSILRKTFPSLFAFSYSHRFSKCLAILGLCHHVKIKFNWCHTLVHDYFLGWRITRLCIHHLFHFWIDRGAVTVGASRISAKVGPSEGHCDGHRRCGSIFRHKVRKPKSSSFQQF